MAILEHTGRRDLTVDGGEIVSVLGAPGSGKSRLALELAFLRRPDDGEVLFQGKNPQAGGGRFSAMRRPRDVTILVQNAEDQLFARTVYDDVSFGPRRLGIGPDEVEARVLVALSAVGLDPAEIRDRSPFALSGGERRRVALAGMLAMEPEVLILDEPTANLDPHTRREFIRLLNPLRGRSAIVWFTTSAREAAEADRTYLLQNDVIRSLGAAGDMFADWRDLASAGVELPVLYDLAGALVRRGMPLPATGTPVQMTAAIAQAWKKRRDDR